MALNALGKKLNMGQIDKKASTRCPLFGQTTPLGLAPIEEFDMFAPINIATSAAPLSFTEGTPIFTLYSTCASVHASTSAEPFYVKSVMTGAAGVGGRARFHLYSDVALGAWCNPLKAHMEFGSSGRVTGLASAVCGEVELSASCTQGHYAAFEAELLAGSGAKLGGGTSALYVNGIDTDGLLNDQACLFEIGAVFTSDAAHMWYDHQGTDPTNAEEWVRVRTPSGLRYIALYNAVV